MSDSKALTDLDTPCLLLDEAQSAFLDNVGANELLAGKYREPYVLPESG